MFFLFLRFLDTLRKANFARVIFNHSCIKFMSSKFSFEKVIIKLPKQNLKNPFN